MDDVSMNHRPRLLVLSSTFPRGPDDGTPPFVRDLAIIEARDFETMVVVPRTPGAPRHESADGLTIERFRFFLRRWEDIADGNALENVRARRSRLLQVPFYFGSQILATRRAIKRFQPDVVHLHWIIPQGVLALPTSRRIPWLVTSPGADVYALNGRGWTWLKHRVVRRAVAVTTMNRDMRERLLRLGAAPEKVTVLPMGADVDRVRRGLQGQEPVPGRLLFAGRLVEKKGLGTLLDGLAQVPRELPWTLDVVGDGPLAHSLKKQAAGFGDRVVFHGQVAPQELSARYAECEIVVVPSVPASTGDQDGLPVVLLEALVAGRAIVASKLPGLDEAIVDGEHGLLVEPGDPDALARTITALLESPALRTQLARAARSRGDRYGVETIGQRYVALLHDIVAAAPAARR